ncbi:MAG TPA: alpha/beta hydrolase [Rhodocyclaceae bacterium]
MRTSDIVSRHRVEVTGVPSGRPLLFVHGFGTDGSAWQRVAAKFSTSFRVVTFDNAGIGKDAEFPQSSYLNLHAYASDVAAIAQALDLTDVVLVGHSAGAMMGLLAAVNEPQRFSALVLVGASPRYLDGEGYRGGFAKEDLDRIYSAVMTDYGQWADRFAPAMMRNAGRPDLALDFAEALKSIPPDRALTVLCSIFQSDHRSELSKVRCPTLVIQARNDMAVPFEVACYLRDHIAGAQLALIDAEGHLPHVSAPDQVIGAIRNFLV